MAIVARQAGFTLLELVVALALGMLTVAVVYSIYLTQARSMAAQNKKLAMQQEVRAVSDLVVRELRQAGYDPAGVNRDTDLTNDFLGISGNASHLVIQADLNGDGKTDDSHERVSFSYDPNTFTLRRNTGGGRQPFGDSIASFEVQYFDRNGHLTTLPTQIRQVRVRVVGKSITNVPRSASPNGSQAYALRALVVPRNLGLGH